MRIGLHHGVLAGLLVMACLFVLGLWEASDLSYMGQTDEGWARIVLGRQADDIVRFQGALLAAHLVLGVVLGGGAALLRLGLTPLLRRLDRSRLLLLVHAPLVLLIHGLVLGWGVARRPAAYAEWLHARGGVWARLQDLAAQQVPGWAYGAAAAALALLAARGLILALREAHRGRRRLLLGALLLGCAAGATGTGLLLAPLLPSRPPSLPPPPAHRPHLLLVVVDSLRPDRLGPGGPAPHLTALAREGSSFERALVPLARTFPSCASLLTGRLPVHHGVRHMFPSPGTLASIGPTLPGHLRALGYRTAVVGDYAADVFSRWDAGFELRRVPGFDMATVARIRGLAVHRHLLPYLEHPLARRSLPELEAHADLTDPDAVVDDALELLDGLAASGDPVALMVFLSGAHFPYAARAPYRGSRGDPSYAGPYRYRYSPPLDDDGLLAPEDAVQVRALYDEAVAATDAAVGRLLDGLGDRGLGEHTLVVATADHGEGLHEEGVGFEHGAHLRGDGSLRVPLILAGPGIPANRTLGGLVRSYDLAPTLLELLRLPPLPLPVDGVSLAPALRSGADPPPSLAYAETGLWFRASGQAFYQQDRLPYPELPGLIEPLPDGGFALRPGQEAQVITAKHRMVEDLHGRLIVVPTPQGPREEWHPAPEGPGSPPPELRQALAALDRADGPRRALQGPAALPAPPGEARLTVRHRLLDLLGEARLAVPALSEAQRHLRGFRRWIVDPWAPRAGGRAPQVGVVFGHKPVPEAEVHVNRRALYLPPPAFATWPLELPEKARLSLGLLSPRDIPGLRGRPVRFEVALRPMDGPGEHPEGERVLLSAEVDGPGSPGRQHWADREIDLGEWGGRRVEITLRTELLRHRTGVAHAFVSAPVILAPPSGGPARHNVLFLVVDALRASDVGALGGAPGLTPHLDAIVASGTSFSQSMSNHTWTRASTLALLTGQDADRLGVNRHSIELPRQQRRAYYDLRPPLLPVTVREGGWRTDAAINNLFMLGSHGLGLDFGFQRMVDFRHLVLDTPNVTAAAREFIEANTDVRWFLFVNLNALHSPYTAPQRYWDIVDSIVPDAQRLPRARRGYLAELAYTDDHVGRIMETLDKTGQRENTIVVLTADHGEVMDPAHQRMCRAGDVRMGALYFHGLTAYDEELRVPLVFAAPGVIPAGRSLSQQVQSLDVAPTLLEFLGLPPEPRHQGMSLAPALLRGEPLPERGLRFSSRFCRGVRRTTLKYARYETHEDSGCLPEGTEELYDLAQDPDELHDLAGSGDPRLAEARAELDRLEQDAALPLPGLEGRDGAREALPDLHLDEGVDPEIQRLLHEWGYR